MQKFYNINKHTSLEKKNPFFSSYFNYYYCVLVELCDVPFNGSSFACQLRLRYVQLRAVERRTARAASAVSSSD